MRQVDANKTRRRLGDGGGLWLNLSKSGSKSWIFRWTPKGGRPREIGLGPYPDLSLANARKMASENREFVANGIDPKSHREQTRVEQQTFGQVAELYLASMSARWTNSKTQWQWEDSLRKRCAPICNRPVSEIETQDVLQVLNPIWKKTPETASRVRMRMEAVLNFAKAKHLRSGENPAAWRGHLDQILVKRDRRDKKHHPAMPYEELPTFIVRLQNAEALAARALELAILTGTRTKEVLQAVWSEIDLDSALWVIPKERMKNKQEHSIPLSDRAVEILSPLYSSRSSEYVFPGQKQGKPLSNMSMSMLLRRLKVDNATPHGFRSTFRDWAGDKTNFPREIAEMALSHKIGSAVEQAYRRSDALEKRRQLMQAWADYCTGHDQGNVVALHG
ncbi:MAG: integrase arm-type DNA-binding domain-containing protein [Rhizobiaceae bacterium]